MQAEIVILGSGTSMGVPTLGCTCPVCTSSDPRNRRLRPSIAIEWPHRRVIIDTGPDFREQVLREGIRDVDAVFYTHPHADHILGMDDLRPLSFRHKPGHLPLYADEETARILTRIVDYTVSPESIYPPHARFRLHVISGHVQTSVHDVAFQRIPLQHGPAQVSGFRFGSAAYLTDMKTIPDSSLPLLRNLDVLILDGLRPEPHPSHANLEEALHWVEVLQPRRAWLTHMSHEVDHATTEAAFPPHVRLSYDGLRIPIEL